MGKFLVGLLAFYTVGSIGAMAMNLPDRLAAIGKKIEENEELDSRNRKRAIDLSEQVQQ